MVLKPAETEIVSWLIPLMDKFNSKSKLKNKLCDEFIDWKWWDFSFGESDE